MVNRRGQACAFVTFESDRDAAEAVRHSGAQPLRAGGLRLNAHFARDGRPSGAEGDAVVDGGGGDCDWDDGRGRGRHDGRGHDDRRRDDNRGHRFGGSSSSSSTSSSGTDWYADAGDGTRHFRAPTANRVLIVDVPDGVTWHQVKVRHDSTSRCCSDHLLQQFENVTSDAMSSRRQLLPLLIAGLRASSVPSG